MLGNYLLDYNFVEVSNYNYTQSDIDSSTLLEMICRDAYSGNDGGLVSLIRESKYITISIGMNDVLQYIRFDSSNQNVEFDKDYIKRKLEKWHIVCYGQILGNWCLAGRCCCWH